MEKEVNPCSCIHFNKKTLSCEHDDEVCSINEPEGCGVYYPRVL